MRSVIGHGRRRQLFTTVKYVTYGLLLTNVFLFLQEELASLEHTFVSGMTLADFVQVFASTIDTAAWVVLLLLFELETSILDDERIRGWTKRSIHGTRLLCGAAIVWAFTGYYSELVTLYRVELLTAFDACAVSGNWSVLQTMDEYLPLSAANCGALGGESMRIQGFNILAPPDVLQSVRYLAWTDVLNAGAWILVVVVLEVEVRLQLKGRLTDTIVDGTRYLKYGLYSMLFAAAAYWGYAGDFLDFWDASLWLFAFIFIEMNVFDWQQETTAELRPAQA